MARLKFDDLRPGMLFGSDVYHVFVRTIIIKIYNENILVFSYVKEEDYKPKKQTLTLHKKDLKNNWLIPDKLISESGYREVIPLIFEEA
jgi:hypothetical protein